MRHACHAYRILVLGGYGHFGGRICRALVVGEDATLIVAGRDALKAEQFARALVPNDAAAHESAALDYTANDLAARIRALRADAVIHTGGPFQGQGYHVARACVQAGAHYIDLADGRAFVAGITALDAAARERGVLVASGASTLPALSSAVIDEHLGHFSRLDSIDISIAPGQQTPRGVATLESVLSYCGKPFEVFMIAKERRTIRRVISALAFKHAYAVMQAERGRVYFRFVKWRQLAVEPDPFRFLKSHHQNLRGKFAGII